MRRYTVSFYVLDNKLLDEQSMLDALSSVNPGAKHLLVCGISTQVDDRVLVELKSNKDKRGLATLFARLNPNLGIQLNKIAWGWLISDPVLRDIHAADKAIYPITPRFSYQALGMERYTYGFTMTFLSIIYSMIFLISVVAFVVGFADWVHPLALFGPDIASTMRFSCPIPALGALYMLYSRVATLVCDQSGIEIHYSFRPPQRFDWQEIVGMRIYRAWRSERVCSIQGISRSLGFPIDEGYKMRNRDVLIMTIIQRAKLIYVEGTSWENAVYKHSDAT